MKEKDSYKNRAISVDIILGFLSLIISFSIISLSDLRVGLISMGLIVLLIGFVRYRESEVHPAVKALVLVSPYSLLLLGVLNGMAHLLLLTAIAYLGPLVGVYIRVFLWNRRMVLSTLLLSAYLPFICFFGLTLLPAYWNKIHWDTVKQPVTFSYKLLKPNGDTLYSSDLKGKIVVLDFWATWCGPCKKQFPVFESLHQKYDKDERIVFLFINCGRKKNENLETIKSFMEKSKHQLPFVLDIDDRVKNKFIVGGFPTSLIIDQNGIRRYEHHGYKQEENFLEECSKRIDILLQK